MHCETAKVQRATSMFEYHRNELPLRLCGLRNTHELAGLGQKVNFFFKYLWPPPIHEMLKYIISGI